MEVWCQDEHRLGLKPVLRRVWALKGKRPIVKVHPRYEWLYLYGFARPATGQNSWLILPTVNIAVYSLALAEFAREVGVGPGKQVILVIDQAGWHISEKVEVPKGMHLVFLPACSPELQPAERLWPLANEGVCNQNFASLDDLEEALVRRCCAMMDNTQIIRDLVRYDWWPTL